MNLRLRDGGGPEAVGADKIKEVPWRSGQGRWIPCAEGRPPDADQGQVLGELDRKFFAKGGKPARDEQDARRRQELSEACPVGD